MLKRVRILLLLIGRYAVDAIRANFLLARVLLTPGLKVEPVELVIPTRAETAFEILVLANLISFTSGTLTVDLVPGRQIVVHTIDPELSDERMIRQNLERPLLQLTRGHE
jgi:multisubunit Na+/H+ antiporter MnhE subunit